MQQVRQRVAERVVQEVNAAREANAAQVRQRVTERVVQEVNAAQGSLFLPSGLKERQQELRHSGRQRRPGKSQRASKHRAFLTYRHNNSISSSTSTAWRLSASAASASSSIDDLLPLMLVPPLPWVCRCSCSVAVGNTPSNCWMLLVKPKSKLQAEKVRKA